MDHKQVESKWQRIWAELTIVMGTTGTPPFSAILKLPS